MAFINKYHDYLLINKDKHHCNSHDRTLDLFKLTHNKDAQYFGVQVNFYDALGNFSFEELPDESKKKFDQQYKEVYIYALIGLILAILTLSACLIIMFMFYTPAAILLSLDILPLLIITDITLLISSIMGVICTVLGIHNINIYQQNDKIVQLNTTKSQEKNSDDSHDLDDLKVRSFLSQ